MTNKKLVTTGLITALLVSNLVVTYQFQQEIKGHEKKIEELNKINIYRQGLIEEKRDKIDVLREVIQDNKNQIDSLKQQLEKAKKRNESPTSQISRGQTNNPKIHMIATAYVSHCYGCSGITKVGINVRNTIEHNGLKIIAVDPRVIPLHSIVKVSTKDGTFLAYAADTGGKIKNYKIDILIDTYNEQKAFEFGKQHVTVQILRNGEG